MDKDYELAKIAYLAYNKYWDEYCTPSDSVTDEDWEKTLPETKDAWKAVALAVKGEIT